MAVSKRLRFEILRRDNHACRYCGATAPDSKLTVDHVVPVALGGTDESSNLVTACSGCNTGKSSISPDSEVVVDVVADALRWAHAMRQAAEAAELDIQHREKLRTWFDFLWGDWTYGCKKTELPRPNDWFDSVLRWHEAGIPGAVIADSIR